MAAIFALVDFEETQNGDSGGDYNRASIGLCMCATTALIHTKSHLTEVSPCAGSHCLTPINFKLCIQLPHRPLRMLTISGVVTLIFKVTEVTRDKFGFQTLTPNVL